MKKTLTVMLALAGLLLGTVSRADDQGTRAEAFSMVKAYMDTLHTNGQTTSIFTDKMLTEIQNSTGPLRFYLLEATAQEINKLQLEQAKSADYLKNNKSISWGYIGRQHTALVVSAAGLLGFLAQGLMKKTPEFALEVAVRIGLQQRLANLLRFTGKSIPFNALLFGTAAVIWGAYDDLQSDRRLNEQEIRLFQDEIRDFSKITDELNLSVSGQMLDATLVQDLTKKGEIESFPSAGE
jgi:hypothetical protein